MAISEILKKKLKHCEVIKTWLFKITWTGDKPRKGILYVHQTDLHCLTTLWTIIASFQDEE